MRLFFFFKFVFLFPKFIQNFRNLELERRNYDALKLKYS